MTKCLRAFAFFASLVGILTVSICCQAATNKERHSSSRLVALAAARFPNLTRCERAVLEYADLETTTHKDLPPCGPSPNFNDPTNDPKNAVQWPHDRDLRAELIRWLFVDPVAAKQVAPGGVEALGAKVVGSIDLELVHAPFPLGLVRSSITEPLNLNNAEISGLYLLGTHTVEIEAGGSRIHGPVVMCCGFEASSEVVFGNSRIDSDFDCNGGRFTHSKDSGDAPWAAEKPALFLGVAKVQGPIWLSAGFKAEGAVDVNGATCDSLMCFGGRFINPGNVALNAESSIISASAVLSNSGKWSGMEADGLVEFDGARIDGYFLANNAKFLGKATEPHGVSADGLSVAKTFIWENVDLRNGATLNLRSASVNGLADDEQSWPQPGRFALDGFVYRDFYAGPTDARSRLRWLGLASGAHPPWLVAVVGFHPQPYRELSKVLHERGDDAGATFVLITAEDLRYAQYGMAGRAWGGFLKWTIGYGHQPLRAIVWSLVVILMGWAVVSISARAGLMRQTWPESPPAPSGADYEPIHPLLYSLDLFLPFVNLHQEHYWWPKTEASADRRLLGIPIRLRGSIVRYYLWLQIIAGWLLSAIFLAGVTGLIRND